MPKNRKRKVLGFIGGTEPSVASTKHGPAQSVMLVSTHWLRREIPWNSLGHVVPYW